MELFRTVWKEAKLLLFSLEPLFVGLLTEQLLLEVRLMLVVLVEGIWVA